MARSTPRKVSDAEPSNGNLLTFFKKGAGSNAIGRVKVKQEPTVDDASDRTPRRGSSISFKGKGKARDLFINGHGSEVDPLVISDDDNEDDEIEPTSSKRRKLAPTQSPVQDPGPSRSPRRVRRPESCTPPPALDSRTGGPQPVNGDSEEQGPSFTLLEEDFLEEKPPEAFPNLPGFKPPSSWPAIINTGDMGGDEEPDDADGSQRGMGSELGQDEDPVDRDMDIEGVDVAATGGTELRIGVLDGMQTHPEPPDIMDVDDEVDPDPAKITTSTAGGNISNPLTGYDTMSDLGMEWNEPEDEGMGMEEDGDDEASDIVETPPPRVRTHSLKSQGKVTICPVCNTSLKGKSPQIIQNHINTCLDSGDGKSKKSPRVARPITSINHTFSPAPSTPSPPPEEVVQKGPNAFSVLMSGHKEKEEWKDAEVDLKRDGKRFFGRRKAPFYKVLTGMPVAVDAFRYGAIPKVTAYLLTHAHSDHYTNLSKSWKEGPIYCSETTANLIIHMLGVEPQWVHGLPNDIPFEMPNTGGVTVTPIEANHCPGSSIFLFEGRQTVNAGDSTIKSPYVGSKRQFRFLHCGDFRACPKMVLHPAIARAKIDTCYLDTTYLNPKYCFPPQPQVIEACATLARKEAMGVSSSALSLEEIKPGIKGENMAKFDIKPDVNWVKAENEEKSKAMMAGWLVKRESEDEVPQDNDSAPVVGVTDSGNVKMEPGVKPEPNLDIKPDPDGAAAPSRPSAGFAAVVNTDPTVKTEEDLKPKEEQLVALPTIKREKPPARTLIVMGTYSIGKERIVKAVARALGTKIYCDPRKKGLLLCQTDPDLHAMLSSDPIESQVHLVPLSNIQLDRLQPYLARLYPHFDRVLGFRPTGWAYTPPAGTDMLPDVNQVIRRDQSRSFSEASLRPMRGSCKQFMMYGVPYSEHSSFFELTCFALSVPGPNVKMIATVNVHNEKSRAKMKKWFEKWEVEKARRKEKNLPAIVDYRDENFW